MKYFYSYPIINKGIYIRTYDIEWKSRDLWEILFEKIKDMYALNKYYRSKRRDAVQV